MKKGSICVNSLQWIRNKHSNLLTFLENKKEVIPLSRIILLYLKIPMTLRIIVTLIFFGISHGLAYVIGFIILQSKARNEVLSLITAFQNPINFDDRLYFYYAFVYLFITFISIVPLGLSLFYGRYLLKKVKPRRMLFIIVFLTISFIVAAVLFVVFQFAPLLPYYLFYASKNSSFWEVLIKYFVYKKELQWTIPLFDLMDFQKEVFISLTSGNMAVMTIIFFFFINRNYAKEREKSSQQVLNQTIYELDFILYLKSNWAILKINLLILHLRFKNFLSIMSNLVFIYIFLFATLIIFVSHTAYQLGGFGKNLAQFDTDFVSVDFNFIGTLKNVEGIRVYQDRNYLIIRDRKNTIHTISSDQIHIQTKLLH